MRRHSRSDDWDFDYFDHPAPLPADGIRAQSQRGGFACNWWAQRWEQVIESCGWGGRLSRGRAYARRGQVLSLDVTPGLVSARVQGSRRVPYRADISVKRLSDAQWERAIAALAEQALFAAQLLAGEMPPEIERVFGEAGVSLFPDVDDFLMYCSCPDDIVPCKHLAAVYYLLSEELDRDPFLLFTLRGRTRDEVLQALQAHRAASGSPAQAAGLLAAQAGEPPSPSQTPADVLEGFWQRGDTIQAVPISLAPPPVETALLKRLGSPPFSKRPAAFIGALSLVYASVSRRARELATGGGAAKAARDEG